MDAPYPYAQGDWLVLEKKEGLKSFSSTRESEVDDSKEPVDRILRGPIWNYGRKKYDEKEFCEELLFGKIRKSFFNEEELIVHGMEWIPAHHSNESLAEYFFRKMKTVNPESIALMEVETGRKLNYGQLVHQAQSLATGLQWLGVRPGNVIALVSYNSLEAQLILLAALFIGAITAPLDSSLNSVDIGALLRITRPDLVFTECGKTLHKVETALGYLTVPRRPRLVVNSRRLTHASHSHFMFTQLLRDVEPNYLPTFREENLTRPVLILYTSGTSSMPKGALLAERFYMRSRLFMESVFANSGPAYTSLLSPPLFWISAISNLFIHLKEGHRIAFFRGPPSEPVIVSALRKYKVLFWVTGPTSLMHLLNWPTKPRCPFLRFIITTGMPFPKENLIKVKDDLFEGKTLILQIYGLTEAGIMTSNTVWKNKIGSVGKVFFNVKMKVLEKETGILQGPGMVGELCFKSQSMMLGYYNNPEATERAFDEQGFLHTGDLGYYDEQGYVYITGRIKEMIKWKSYQVTPMEVEAHLLNQNVVQEALVFGLYDDKEGELVTAAVILKPGHEDTDPGQIEREANSYLSNSKKIRGGVHFFLDFPRTATGKPIRALIAKKVLERLSSKGEATL